MPTNPTKATNFVTQLESSGEDFVSVTPSDSTDLTDGCSRALYITTGGVLKVITRGSNGSTRTITVTDFTILPLQVLRVISTGTTATGIHAIY